MADLDEALKVGLIGSNEWRAFADPDYEAINAMFGGWTSAVALNAVSHSAEPESRPSAMTINFIGRIEPGSEVVIRTRRVGGSRSISHWLAEIRLMNQDETLALATVSMARRRDTDGLIDCFMPEAPDPETLEIVHPPGPQGQQSILRPVSGIPAFGRDNTRSLHWIRDQSGRKVDYVQLAYLADQLPPRSFYWSNGPRPSATITTSVFFHATDGEIEAVGDDYILVAGTATRGVRSTSGLRAELWSRQGVLLSTSEQLAWFR